MSGLKRAIDLRSAISINVITMIGIGPLVTIPLVVAALGGPLALVGWVAGAIVALCDGLVWAELSSRFPGSGGTYVYLRNVFGAHRLGKALAFLFNWQFLLAAPCLLASGYIGFANYAAYFYPGLGSNVAAHDALAVGIGIVTIMLLYRRTAGVASFGVVLAAAATLTVALVAVAGLSHANFTQAFHLSQPLRLGAGFVAGFGSALYITLYDYAGYAEAALLGDEVVRPERTIPKAIVLSVLIVATLYVLLQIGVLGVVPWRSLLDAHGQPTMQAQYVGSVRRREDLGTFRRHIRDAARAGDGLCVALRKSSRILAHFVCGSPRRRVSSGLCPASSAQRFSLRCAAGSWSAVVGREPLYARRGHCVSHCGNCAHPRHRADHRSELTARASSERAV